jgi:hypothetical protein
MQVRGAPSHLGGEFWGATDLVPRSVLESVSVQNHIFENESVSGVSAANDTGN